MKNGYTRCCHYLVSRPASSCHSENKPTPISQFSSRRFATVRFSLRSGLGFRRWPHENDQFHLFITWGLPLAWHPPPPTAAAGAAVAVDIMIAVNTKSGPLWLKLVSLSGTHGLAPVSNKDEFYILWTSPDSLLMSWLQSPPIRTIPEYIWTLFYPNVGKSIGLMM